MRQVSVDPACSRSLQDQAGLWNDDSPDMRLVSSRQLQTESWWLPRGCDGDRSSKVLEQRWSTHEILLITHILIGSDKEVELAGSQG